jgi:glycosidase
LFELRSDPYVFPSDCAVLNFTTTDQSGQFRASSFAPAQGGYKYGDPIGSCRGPFEPDRIALNWTSDPDYWESSEDGAAFSSEGAFSNFNGRNLSGPFVIGHAAGLNMALMMFSENLSDAEWAALNSLSSTTFAARGIRLIVEGDSFTQGTGNFNLSVAAYLQSVSSMAGQFSAVDNIGTGGVPLSSGLTNSIADDWTTNDPAAGFVATAEIPNRILLLWGGHNDWAEGNVASVIAGADTVLTRAKELGMRTVVVSVMNTPGTGSEADIEATNAGIAALESCDQMLDLHSEWKSVYGSNYAANTDIFDGDGIHPTTAAGGGYQKAAEWIADNLVMPNAW